MAIVRIQSRDRVLRDDDQIAAYVASAGMAFERWPLEERVSPDASSDEILAAYAGEIDVLKQRGGYVTADVINVTPDTPNLDTMLAKFNKEHTHADDEVRFIVKGRGIFHIHPSAGEVFSIELAAGEFINVPAGTRHWFDLCGDRTIRAIRLFKDMSGWTPVYVEGGVHTHYEPLCLGPSYLSGEKRFKPTVTL